MRRRESGHPARTAWFVVAGLAAFMLVLAGCGGGGSSSGGSSSGGGGGEELQKLGKGEGELNLISWAGYVEEEWVKPF
jgi:putative spermidine/putrescine transport system substrate-binding protein